MKTYTPNFGRARRHFTSTQRSSSENQNQHSINTTGWPYTLCSCAENIVDGKSTFTLYNPSFKPTGMGSPDLDRFDIQRDHDTIEGALSAVEALFNHCERRAVKFARIIEKRIAAERKNHDIALLDSGFVVATVWTYEQAEEMEHSPAGIQMVLDPQDAVAALLTEGVVIVIDGAILSDGTETFECFAKWTGYFRNNEATMYQVGAGTDGLSRVLARWDRPAQGDKK